MLLKFKYHRRCG